MFSGPLDASVDAGGRRLLYGSPDWLPVPAGCAFRRPAGVWLAAGAQDLVVDLQRGGAGLKVQDLTETFSLELQSPDGLQGETERQ